MSEFDWTDLGDGTHLLRSGDMQGLVGRYVHADENVMHYTPGTEGYVWEVMRMKKPLGYPWAHRGASPTVEEAKRAVEGCINDDTLCSMPIEKKAFLNRMIAPQIAKVRAEMDANREEREWDESLEEWSKGL